MSVTVKYNNAVIGTLDVNQTATLSTTDKHMNGNIEFIDATTIYNGEYGTFTTAEELSLDYIWYEAT